MLCSIMNHLVLKKLGEMADMSFVSPLKEQLCLKLFIVGNMKTKRCSSQLIPDWQEHVHL